MVNILLEGFDLSAEWLMPELTRHIKPGSKAAVVALSFRDSDVCNGDDWNALYSREDGKYYGGIAGQLAYYGIAGDDVAFINYFADDHDSAAAKIAAADILYFPGGLPDRMVQRIDEMGLRDVIMRHDGVVMGFSAGAMLQFKEYHISPDKDYSEFVYREGLGWLDGFGIEVHYENSDEQNTAINRVLNERKRTVYAIESMNGAVIVEDGNIRPLGSVKVFEPMMDISKEAYIEAPCRASSIPFWKAKTVKVPDGMKIVHNDEYSADEYPDCIDEPYFRLMHGLSELHAPVLPEGYSVCEATFAEFAAHINRCYGGACVTEEELRGYARRRVYEAQLWVAVKDKATGEITATGIAEMDKDVGEGIIEWIQVSEECRGKGLGSCIVNELLRRMAGKAGFVTVSGRCDNPTDPERLYRRCGFTGNDVWHILMKRV